MPLTTTERTGSGAHIEWNCIPMINGTAQSGTTITLSTDFRAFQKQSTIREVDASAGNDQYVPYIGTLKDGQITMTFLHNGSANLWSVLDAGVEGTLTWGEAGTTAGSPKHVQPCFVRESTLDTPYDNIEIWNLTLRPQGARTDSTY